MFLLGHHARLIFAEDSITIVSYESVEQIPNRSRHYASNACRQGTKSAKRSTGTKNCIGTINHSFVCLLVVFHHVHCVQILRIYSVTAQNSRCEVTLK